jgi:hypothetical protein
MLKILTAAAASFGDAGRCRRCRSASQGAAACGGLSGWQVSGWQVSVRIQKSPLPGVAFAAPNRTLLRSSG